MAWYGRPAVAYLIYIPAAAAGLLLPYLLRPARASGPTPAARCLGTALLFAIICSGLTSIGMHSSFFYAIWAACAALAAALLGTGPGSAGAGAGWGGALGLALCYAAPVGISLPSAVTFMVGGWVGEWPGVLLRGWHGQQLQGVPASRNPACCLTPFSAFTLGCTHQAHVMEKVGLAGAAPGLLGLVVSDVAVGAVAGATLVVAVGSCA